MDKPVLVTGGCGFVGRHVVFQLLEQGRSSWIVDNLSIGKHPEEWLSEKLGPGVKDNNYIIYGKNPYVRFYYMDVRDFFKIYNNIAFGDVFHLAAVVGGRLTIDYEPLAVASDLSIDAEFYNWCVKTKPERILYASSSAVYPVHLQNQEDPPLLREEFVTFDGDIGAPDLTYGWSKLTGEFLSRLAVKKYGMHVACIRPFSGYGEDQDITYPIPAIARRAVRRENPLVVWGSGRQVRDFVHIDDCIDVMFLALEKISDGTAVNIGSGIPLTFMEVAKIFAEIVGYNPDIRNLDDKPQGPSYRCADISRMKNLLGWEPRISVREGFLRVVEAVKVIEAIR